MFQQVARIVSHRPSDVLEDAVGVAAIFVVVLAGLWLPGLI